MLLLRMLIKLQEMLKPPIRKELKKLLLLSTQPPLKVMLLSKRREIRLTKKLKVIACFILAKRN